MVTYHPVTLEDESSEDHFQSILNVLAEMNDINLIFTMPNADSDARSIFTMIETFVSNHSSRAISFKSMGHLNYLSALQFVDGVLGNSSSGLCEAPSFKIGTVNIGDRQKGRLKAESVIDCEPTEESIKSAIEILYSNKFRSTLKSVLNPYGEGNATKKILEALKNNPIPEEIKKEFHDL